MNNREHAKRLMKHYFRVLANAAGARYVDGKRWNSDYDAELDTLCDCLINAAKEELREEMQPVTQQVASHERTLRSLETI